VKGHIRLENDCEHSISNKDCEKKTRRIEEDIAEELNDCHEKSGKEMCATINCKFVNDTEECSDRETTTLVQLTTRECTLCEPTLGSKVEVEEICEEEIVDDCRTDPLTKKWRKLCESDSDFITAFMSINDLVEHQEEFRSNKENSNRKNRNILLKDILDKSLSPVNDLVVETLKNIHLKDLDNENPVVIIPTIIGKPGARISSEEDKLIEMAKIEEKILKEELDILETINSKPTNINLNVKYEVVTKPSTVTPTLKSVYFDPLLQLIDTQIRADPIHSEKPLLEETTPKPQEVALGQNNLSAIAGPLISDINKHKTKEISGVESTTKKTKEPTHDLTAIFTQKFHQTERVLEADTTHLIPFSTGDSDLPPTTTETSRLSKTLTAADYLKLCFTSGRGCDFSNNKNNNKIIPDIPEVKQIQTTTNNPLQLTTTANPKTSDWEREEKLKAKVRLCFFAGICNDDDRKEHQEKVETKTTTTTTRKPRTPTKKTEASRLMEERIRLRAYLCFSEGKCN